MWTGGNTGKCGGRLLENVDVVWKNVDRVADKENKLCVGVRKIFHSAPS